MTRGTIGNSTTRIRRSYKLTVGSTLKLSHTGAQTLPANSEIEKSRRAIYVLSFLLLSSLCGFLRSCLDHSELVLSTV
ncbi:Hypothetical predicted protein [Olea europaea subsp. europaea]|uniref:Uncharacterized protein n=1 Tax=Olea europaea subsp. europaea TaxID=158383 RepID=A0A8S0SU56_OLEEU|nr:Hypothetical predicted protein [Olea europaea subsp. europaea]